MKTIREYFMPTLLGIFAGITVITLGFKNTNWESYVIVLLIVKIYNIFKIK